MSCVVLHYTKHNLSILICTDYCLTDPKVTLAEAAKRLQVSAASIRRMIAEETLPASQVVECAPWEISAEALDSELVRKAVSNIKNRVTSPRTQIVDSHQTMFSEG